MRSHCTYRARARIGAREGACFFFLFFFGLIDPKRKERRGFLGSRTAGKDRDVIATFINNVELRETTKIGSKYTTL